VAKRDGDPCNKVITFGGQIVGGENNHESEIGVEKKVFLFEHKMIKCPPSIQLCDFSHNINIANFWGFGSKLELFY